MKTYLKVKIMSLAEEARIIRTQERRTVKAWRKHRERQGNPQRSEAYREELAGLHGHRVGIVRCAAREAQLAYAYARGRPYNVTEATGSSTPDLRAISKLLNRYHKSTTDDEIKAWIVAT